MKAAFFDVDGTLTRVRVWQGLIDYFKSKRMRRTTYAVYWLYHMWFYLLHKIGLLSQTAFRAPWAAHLPWLFRGYSEQAAQEIWDWVLEFLRPHWWEASREILQRHLEAGDLVVLVSAGPEPLLKRIAEHLGTSHAVGTRPKVRDGVYTGGTDGPACIAEHKASFTKRYLESQGLQVDLAASYAYADAPGDLALLEMVGHPAALNPDDELRAIAEERGWPILPE